MVASSAQAFTGGDAVLIVVIVLLIIVTAFLALSETAITRMSRHKAAALAEEVAGGRRLLGLVEHTERVLPVVLFALEVTTLVAATLVGIVTARVFGALGVVIGTVFEIIVIFVVAELVPKTWAVQHSQRAALLAAPIVAALMAFPPLRWITRGLIAMSNAILPGKGIKQGPYVSEEELLAMADTAADEEVIEREERTLIHSIIDFGDTVVREVMVPRPDMVVVESRGLVADVIDITIAAGYSRIPVYGQGIDDIIGIVYAKDLLRAEREGRQGEQVSAIMREAQFTPESKRVSELMREMQLIKQHMAIVVDEYGGTAGLVTLEDLIEEIVGEIVDEYDMEEAAVQRLGDGGLRVTARMPIDEVNDLIEGRLPEGDWDTVGGLVYSRLGHVPSEGEEVDCDGVVLVAERVQGRRIGRVRISPVAHASGAEAERPDS
ncbi:MAG TPA: hemolysin family protein [Acidimicrobiales bacterium]|jgi:CBS domain containing-hemolysin-like protein|nr:hemolysin family protein [Acidimicrobiales bacterium]